MSDVHCPRCGEPWDTDEFHDIADEHDMTFDDVYKAFRRNGCSAVDARCNRPHPTPDALADTIYDLTGDDVDAAAALFGDARQRGML